LRKYFDLHGGAFAARRAYINGFYAEVETPLMNIALDARAGNSGRNVPICWRIKKYSQKERSRPRIQVDTPPSR